jgi:hypothetical protein
MIILVNPGSGPVVFDDEGHSLGGGERREVATLHPVAQRAVAAGYLLTEEKAEPGGKPEPGGKADDAKPDPPARRSGKS